MDGDIAAVSVVPVELLIWGGRHRSALDVLRRGGIDRARGDSDDGERKDDGDQLAEEVHLIDVDVAIGLGSGFRGNRSSSAK